MRRACLLGCLIVALAARHEGQRLDRRRAAAQSAREAPPDTETPPDSILAELGGEGWYEVVSSTNASADAFIETGVGNVHGYCEICIRTIQMYQRGLPDVCAGLTDTFFITVRASLLACLRVVPRCMHRFFLQCVKNLESILKADRAVSYWHRVGCVHLDDGPEVVKPCPAHAICGWVPNIFARRTGVVVGSVGQLSPLCPRDVAYLPRVPRTAAPAGLPGASALAPAPAGLSVAAPRVPAKAGVRAKA